jgi:hypothetical protein
MRTRYIQDSKGRLIQVDENWTPEPRSDYHIMPDIKPYRSMADGSLVNSRSAHREMLKRNNCFEVGNDSSLYKPRKPLQPPPGLKEKIIRAVELEERKSRR